VNPLTFSQQLLRLTLSLIMKSSPGQCISAIATQHTEYSPTMTCSNPELSIVELLEDRAYRLNHISSIVGLNVVVVTLPWRDTTLFIIYYVIRIVKSELIKL